MIENTEYLWSQISEAAYAFGPRLITAIVVVLIGYILAKWLVKHFTRPIAIWLKRPALVKPALTAIKYLIIVIFILIGLRIVGIELTNILLSATIMSVIVGVVVAPIAANFISGAFLLSDRPYDVGDLIHIPNLDRTGFVKEITMSYTRILTLEDTSLVVPNRRMRDRDVENFTQGDLRIKRTFDFEISYDSDLDKAREVTKKAAGEVEGVITKQKRVTLMSTYYPITPQTRVKEFGDNGIKLQTVYWLETPYYLKRMNSKVAYNIYKKLMENDIEIPYPHRQIIMNEDKTREK
ncbi:mechanosensitive ion channel family protein [Methanonatronarchaeum sp. AMET-Sl]|uniref:mechanosensitive ion channel family protein n=1 Tax=Methanonatronarchaeum sp. AMET-Sl TaxID=3037654 RepID=UPI00244E36BB|nr:mechanosensitive ion channel family protein [Methanonatronarchaeum sp. AMET-Sl]WGI17346.1 mechanosensitive ion channel family protein [Methanonatronarchaeum sp. AMET-Sl]